MQFFPLSSLFSPFGDLQIKPKTRENYFSCQNAENPIFKVSISVIFAEKLAIKYKSKNNVRSKGTEWKYRLSEKFQNRCKTKLTFLTPRPRL